jgi:N utilization substance protein A
VIVPNDQLALAIGKEGLNARLATRLTGWKIDIQSEQEFAQAEAEAAYGGAEDGEEFSGRCAAVLSNGKRCPNAALPGSRFCGVPAHQELVNQPAAADGGEPEETDEELVEEDAEIAAVVEELEVVAVVEEAVEIEAVEGELEAVAVADEALAEEEENREEA